MNSGKKAMNTCPLCGVHSFLRCDRDPQQNRLMKCSHCGLLRIYSVQKYTVHQNIWSGDRSFFGKSFAVEYTKGEKWRRRIARDRLDRIERKIPGGRILDIGCATGLFLDEAAKRGWHTFGVDISSDAVRYGRLHYTGTLLRLGSSEQLASWDACFFDVITCFDTLGYFENPLSVVKECARLLRKNGLLFMTNVHPEKIQENRRGLFNYYFKKDTLHRMLESAGFTNLDSRIQSKNLNNQKTFTWGWLKHRFYPLNRKDLMMIYTEARRGNPQVMS
jgi:2-polyprenyl-3-methyl-5-hydroxy-6-metoxy-1,4-benzoquinol methylase